MDAKNAAAAAASAAAEVEQQQHEQEQEQQQAPEKTQSMEERFEEWMVKFQRVYKDAEEKQRRFKIFAENAVRIDSFNASGKHSYTQGLNDFSDWTKEEIARYCLSDSG